MNALHASCEEISETQLVDNPRRTRNERISYRLQKGLFGSLRCCCDSAFQNRISLRCVLSDKANWNEILGEPKSFRNEYSFLWFSIDIYHNQKAKSTNGKLRSYAATMGEKPHSRPCHVLAHFSLVKIKDRAKKYHSVQLAKQTALSHMRPLQTPMNG
jgi:hypothetical protein